METRYTSKQITELIEGKLSRHFGREPGDATPHQFYKATSLVVKDILSGMWMATNDICESHQEKEVFYLSMEFLPGQSLKNNLFNLGYESIFEKALSNFGRQLEDMYKIDPDAGLGNGGLGRLASCYMDGLCANRMSGKGFSICYEHGIFKQKIVNGEQTEMPDNWLTYGDVWLVEKEDEIEEIRFGGTLHEEWDEEGHMELIHRDYTPVLAIPYDMLISGYDSPVVNSLRLWKAGSPDSIDMAFFSHGDYLRAMEKKAMAEVISKILYPEDNHNEGKKLRIKQQYFFVSASLKSILKRHMKRYGTLDNLHKKNVVHINDTHPVLAIPELLRLMIDEYGYKWDKAWAIVQETIAYTNHTVLVEALERWPEEMLAVLLPRIHSILREINKRVNATLMEAFPEDEYKRASMAVIYNGEIRMANLAVAAGFSVNGVSSIHSQILKDTVFNGYYQIAAQKFTNVTNGIAYRRWLCQANPKLSNLISTLCGGEFLHDAQALENLLLYQDDAEVLAHLEEIKRANKVSLAQYIKQANDIVIDPDSIFDVQVKRLHEYKRQLLNLFHIIHLYNQICENPDLDMPSRTFIFGAKASAGYYLAKQIIKLANHLAVKINHDPAVKDRIKIVFLENYSVSLSEMIMPASDLSEQISLAGKEASGTGNMKFMINGALTIGTLDGANVEICEAVGEENMFLFGMKVEEVNELIQSHSFRPEDYRRHDRNIFKVLETLENGVNGHYFDDVVLSVMSGFNGSPPDPYYILADFESYRNAQALVSQTWQDRKKWNQMSLVNIAKAGVFSADRSIREYAERIWGIEPIL